MAFIALSPARAIHPEQFPVTTSMELASANQDGVGLSVMWTLTSAWAIHQQPVLSMRSVTIQTAVICVHASQATAKLMDPVKVLEI